MRYQGKINNWKDGQGFGFINPNDGGKQVFVHIKSFGKGQQRPVGNEAVTYELKTDAKGRANAVNVAYVGARAQAATSAGHGNFSLFAAAVFLLLVVGMVFTDKLPLAVLGLYLIASMVAFIAYKFDRSAARNDRRRTPENALHLYALIGGWPGALFAQRLLRHKTSKQSFQIMFWITVMLNCAALGWLLSSAGASVLLSVASATD